jgi:hypothetical protein
MNRHQSRTCTGIARRHHGAALMEIVLAVAVSLSLMVLVAYGASRAGDTLRGNKLQQDVVEMIGNIRQYYRNRPTYFGLTEAHILEQRLAPPALIDASQPLLNVRWGLGEIVVQPDNPTGQVGNNDRYFRIDIAGVPKAHCDAVIPPLARASERFRAYRITGASAADFATYPAGIDMKAPLTHAAAIDTYLRDICGSLSDHQKVALSVWML